VEQTQQNPAAEGRRHREYYKNPYENQGHGAGWVGATKVGA